MARSASSSPPPPSPPPSPLSPPRDLAGWRPGELTFTHALGRRKNRLHRGTPHIFFFTLTLALAIRRRLRRCLHRRERVMQLLEVNGLTTFTFTPLLVSRGGTPPTGPHRRDSTDGSRRDTPCDPTSAGHVWLYSNTNTHTHTHRHVCSTWRVFGHRRRYCYSHVHIHRPRWPPSAFTLLQSHSHSHPQADDHPPPAAEVAAFRIHNHNHNHIHRPTTTRRRGDGRLPRVARARRLATLRIRDAARRLCAHLHSPIHMRIHTHTRQRCCAAPVRASAGR